MVALLERTVLRIETLGTVGPVHHPIIYIIRYGDGHVGLRLVAHTLAAHLAESHAVVVHSHKEHTAALERICRFLTFIGAMPTLARQHDVVVLDAACVTSVDTWKLSRIDFLPLPVLLITDGDVVAELFCLDTSVGRHLSRQAHTQRHTNQCDNRFSHVSYFKF